MQITLFQSIAIIAVIIFTIFLLIFVFRAIIKVINDDFEIQIREFIENKCTKVGDKYIINGSPNAKYTEKEIRELYINREL